MKVEERDNIVEIIEGKDNSGKNDDKEILKVKKNEIRDSIVEWKEDLDREDLIKEIRDLESEIEKIKYLKNKNKDLEDFIKSLSDESEELKNKEKAISLKNNEINKLQSEIKNINCILNKERINNEKLLNMKNYEINSFKKTINHLREIINNEEKKLIKIKANYEKEFEKQEKEFEKREMDFQTIRNEKEILKLEVNGLKKRNFLVANDLLIKSELVDNFYREIEFYFDEIVKNSKINMKNINENMNRVILKVISLRRYWAGVEINLNYDAIVKEIKEELIYIEETVYGKSIENNKELIKLVEELKV